MFTLQREGDRIEARLRWVSDNVTWVQEALIAGAEGAADVADSAAPDGEPRSTPDSVETDPPVVAPSPEAALQAIRGDVGSAEWARDLVRRTLAGLEQVDLDMALSGSIESPSLRISSNLGDAVAASLRREVGREVEAAEARVRAEVNAQIQPLVQEARDRIEGLRTDATDQVFARVEEIDALQARLEERIAELIGGGPY